ncbi:uncharacterized protein LOC102710711 [Oryza brachyantha]|uniref:uncharacterized protein LOC102710711 n=1 Tax=Oryza brachyantha TaxID=4533 RepID=UPI001ADA18B7|nr:uncharacterized protein LOC102710711 [Oryza brachyantha]XP_040381603.1 uncharacterized protein LOC102710711 [Oryza brachyantha]
MEKGGVGMDAASLQDMWDWEVLPDHMSSSISSHGGGHGRTTLGDQETEGSSLPPSEEDAGAGADMAVDECKDIGVDVAADTKTGPEAEEPPMAAKAAQLPASDGAEEEEAFQSSDDATKVIDDDDAGGEEDKKGGRGRARPECVVFSVGKLRVNGIGALCSFGVAAATVCIFLVGGRLQHHHRQQQQKIQLQLYGDDKRMQQVVQQTSRLNQAMSSVMGGGGSTRANISFGGYYEGF